MARLKKKAKPAGLRGQGLAKHIFETWEGVSGATGRNVTYTSCRAWKNNNVPPWHRAAICAAAVAAGWDVIDDDFRGGL